MYALGAGLSVDVAACVRPCSKNAKDGKKNKLLQHQI